MIPGYFKVTLTSSWGERASLPCRPLSSFPDQWRHAHLRKHRLDFDLSFPPAAESFRAKQRSGWSGGGGGRPVTWKWPLTLWSKGQRAASPARGHAGSHALPRWRLTAAPSNRRRNHMLVTFFRECHCACRLPEPLLSDQLGLFEQKGGQAIVYFRASLLTPHFEKLAAGLRWTNFGFWINPSMRT